MAADASTPAPSKTSRRLHAAGKLTALLGLPVLLIGSIFGGGLYVGATRAYRITQLEARYLGFPDPGGAVWTPPSQRAKASEAALDGESGGGTQEPAATGGAASTGAEEAGDEAGASEGGAAEGRSAEAGATGDSGSAVEPVGDSPDVEPVGDSPDVEPAGGLPIVAADPVGPELRAKFDEARVVHVKLMIDPALAVAREDWLSYASELFSATQQSVSVLFGIELRLQGVVVWSAAQGADPAALESELATHEREGAELILGLVARAEPPGYEAPLWTGDAHGDHGLVFADLEREDRYYHSTLRTLARLFGAQPTAEAEAAELGSFMSPAGSPDGAAPVLDPTNRGQVIFHKQRPFVTRAPAGSDDPGEDAEDPGAQPQEM